MCVCVIRHRHFWELLHLQPRKKVGRCKHKQTDSPPPKEPPETKIGSFPETSCNKNCGEAGV